MIATLAGRRVDAPGTHVTRFPLNNIDAVKEKLRKLFVSLKLGALVCSADTKISNLMNMDLPENVDLLVQIGDAAGKEYADTKHLPATFDLKEILQG